MTRRSIIAVEQLSSDSQALFDVLNHESDLAAVLVGVSFIDACLASMLERLLLESSVATKLLDGTKGALGSLGARSDTCYCLRLIDKSLYQDLLVLGEMRNLVAHHHLALSFTAADVSEKCSELVYITGLKNGNTEEPLFASELVSATRDRFVLSVVMISSRLMLSGLGAKRVAPQA